MIKLFPEVRKVVLTEGLFDLKPVLTAFFTCKKVNVFIENAELFSIVNELDADIVYSVDDKIPKQGYKLEITPAKIYISYSDDAGAYYATQTLTQIVLSKRVECCVIEDSPDMEVRGFMLDISRDKVQKIDEIKRLIRQMSKLRMNHLELYVEGFSFEYQSFKQFLEDDGYITVNEYQELEEYANRHFIDLVPNQNGFGHMEKWLSKEEFKDLAECPDGIYLWGRNRKPSTLNPLDPRSVELVHKMYDDMLPYAKSEYFNMNFDEPFELGKGKSKEKCEEDGLENVYIDYMLKMYDKIKEHKKKPLIWGDVLVKHPESLHRLPDDMIFVDWGYDAGYPFEKHSKKLRELGIKFMCAPGTTSWCSFFGRTYDWIENITNACQAVKNNDGLGVLLTDWGDFGHLQYWPVTYAPLVFMGLYSYRVKEGTILNVKHYLNKFIFEDKKAITADCLMDLGHYSRYLEGYGGNGTLSFYSFMWASVAAGEADPIAYYKEKTKYNKLDYEKYMLLTEFFKFKAKEIKMCECSKLIKSEMSHTIKILNSIHKVALAYNEDVDKDERIRLLEEVVSSMKGIIDGHRRLWLARNKRGGLESSASYLSQFALFAEATLKYLTTRGEGYEKEN